MEDNVIDLEPDEVIIEEPQKLVYRFVGDHLSLNVHHLAYVLNVMGVHFTPEAYDSMPVEVQKHFTLVRV